MRKLASQKNLGFTLIELMLTVALLGILGSLAAPAYFSYAGKARIAGIQRFAQGLITEHDTHHQETGLFQGSPGTPERDWVYEGGDGFRGYRTWGNASGTRGYVQVLLNEKTYPGSKDRQRLMYRGDADSFGNITWRCVLPNNAANHIDPDFLPAECNP